MCTNKLTTRLKQQIEALKGGVTTVASHLGKSRNTIYNWIDKGNAPLDQIEKLGEIGIDIHYILTGCTLNVLPIPGEISETAETYSNENLPLTLESKLDQIIENYIRNDRLSMVEILLDQALAKKALRLNGHDKNQLLMAASKAFDQLRLCDRKEKFDDLLDRLIEAV